MGRDYFFGNIALQNRLFDEQDLLSGTLMRGVLNALQTPLWRQTQNCWMRVVNDAPWDKDWRRDQDNRWYLVSVEG